MKHIVWHEVSITKEQRREKQKNHSFVLWFTGLSASGKSTLANAVAQKLFADNIGVYVLDGDNVRHGLNKDLGFSREDRQENIRRIGEVAKLFVDGGVIVLTAFISPFQEDRKQVRSLLAEGEFLEVFVKCPLEECEKRDPKGLYQKARQGVIGNFTGIHEPYEEPINPEIVVNTYQNTIADCVEQIIKQLKERQYI